MNHLLFVHCRKLILLTSKKYSTACIYNEEFIVNPFCNLFITCPFNVKVRPLDVHKYHNCDKLIVKLYANLSKTKPDITCKQENTNFTIFGKSNNEDTISCVVETPVKSDINIITTQNGNIDVRKFNGEKIILRSELGDIISENCKTSKINFTSAGGNIITHGTLYAGEVEITTQKDAKITINHLQALKASAITENGDISIKSSYCDDTTFQTKTGSLLLDNIHKNCSVIIIKNGLLQMTGFDGTLNADIMEGNIDIQASKLYDLSKITSRKKSTLQLRLSEWIQENTQIKTTCQQLKVSDEVKLNVKNKDLYAVLTPKNSKFTSELEVDANFSNVNVEGASWSDMLKLKGIKFIE